MVSNAPCKFGLPGVREVSDRYKEKGPLGGIHAGLMAASFETVFVTACDMPFFHPELAVRLLDYIKDYEAAVPRSGDRMQPLFSALRRTPALREAGELLQSDRRRLRTLFERLDTFCLDLDCGETDIFYNINYQADYEKLLAGDVNALNV